MKTFISMNIAVIGNASAEIIARKLAKAGHKILMATTGESIIIKRLPKKVVHTSIQAAAKQADLILIAADAVEVRDIAYQLGDVRKKVIIDYTAIASQKVMQTASALKAITNSSSVVKCFMPTGYEDMVAEGVNDNRVDMFVAGDCKKGKVVAAILAHYMGYEHMYDIGEHAAIAMLDEMNAYTFKKNKSEAELALVRK